MVRLGSDHVQALDGGSDVAEVDGDLGSGGLRVLGPGYYSGSKEAAKRP